LEENKRRRKEWWVCCAVDGWIWVVGGDEELRVEAGICGWTCQDVC